MDNNGEQWKTIDNILHGSNMLISIQPLKCFKSIQISRMTPPFPTNPSKLEPNPPWDSPSMPRSLHGTAVGHCPETSPDAPVPHPTAAISAADSSGRCCWRHREEWREMRPRRSQPCRCLDSLGKVWSLRICKGTNGVKPSIQTKQVKSQSVASTHPATHLLHPLLKLRIMGARFCPARSRSPWANDICQSLAAYITEFPWIFCRVMESRTCDASCQSDSWCCQPIPWNISVEIIEIKP